MVIVCANDLYWSINEKCLKGSGRRDDQKLHRFYVRHCIIIRLSRYQGHTTKESAQASRHILNLLEQRIGSKLAQVVRSQR